MAKLGKPADQRKALLRSLTTEVIRHGRIKTTLVRAKAIRPCVDKMIQLSKDGSLHSRRQVGHPILLSPTSPAPMGRVPSSPTPPGPPHTQAMAFIYDKELVHALFENAPERYADREGGYCRVLRTMPRQGDNAKMGIIELV